MEESKLIKNLKIMVQICDECDTCGVCKVKELCSKYCFEYPYDAILVLEKLKGLEDETIY